MTSEDISFSCGGETLIGTIDYNDTRDKPTVLSLHGGVDGGRMRIAPITQHLAAHGVSCLRFDHSGQGDSTGTLSESSLAKRTAEALAAVHHMDQAQPLTVIATSMGGPIALELLKHLDIKTLVLFCPALYAREAFHLRFDQGFSDILRRTDSFLSADMSALEYFTGGFLHIIGENDAIIPAGVTQLYERSVAKASPYDFITIENAPHPLHGWMRDKPAVQRAVIDMVTEFIKA